MDDPSMQDRIFLVLPDGKPVVGRALIVNDPIAVDGAGTITARFDLGNIGPARVAAVLMQVDVM